MLTRSPGEIEELRAKAEAQIWYAPRQGRELAQVAYVAAQASGQDLLLAACTLTLAVALNAMGRFAEAVPLLHTTIPLFQAHGRQARAIRCHSELILAYSYLSEFEAAQAFLASARANLAVLDDPLAQAHCDRAEGLFHQEQNRYPEAAALLRQAGDVFATAGHVGAAALTWCELALALLYVNSQEALSWVQKTRSITAPGGFLVHAARCDHILAHLYDELNRYAESLALYQQVRTIFANEGLDFLTAWCDLSQGVAHYRMNQYDEALQACSQSRSSFTAQGLRSYVARCNLNMAVVLYAANRYPEALALYGRVAQAALDEGRVLRAARCHTNMGLCYDRIGRYDQALVLHHRARETFLAAGSPVYAALCQENLAGTCRRLGRHAEALEHYREARETFAGQAMYIYVARCDTHMADLFLALGRHAEAMACLEQARMTCEQQGMAVYVAVCNREAARVLVKMNQENKALTLLVQARNVFVEEGLRVDVALCDLAAGEAYLNQGEGARAMSCFIAALPVLDPAFLDEAWRAQYGLGRYALALGDRSRALEHWLSAVEMTNRVRAALPTERLSGGFFASRRQLYEETFKLALEVGTVEQTLVVAEAAGAQTFLAWAGPAGWHDVVQKDPYLADLLGREELLRREMEKLRRDVRLLVPEEAGPVMRSAGAWVSDQPQVLDRLAELAQTYEEIVERLRLAAPGWVEAHSPARFSVQGLRQAVAAHLPDRWACLYYYVQDDMLVTFYLDAQRLSMHPQPLSPYDRLVLRQCTHPGIDFRELVYRGTLRGHPAPNPPGRTYLRHLYRLLIPREIEDVVEADLVIIVPHGPLHGLAFQALLADDTPLSTRMPLVYVPGLGALRALMVENRPRAAGDDSIGRTLACGLSDFGAQARPLPYAADEVAVLREVLGERLSVLWGSEATRDVLLHLNATGELANYDVVHFAAHAVLDRLALSQSRVLLKGESLTLTDILGLRLGTRLVVLSTCEGAIGEQQPGDEILGLAQAFFFAGARTVIASLWRVEDASAHEFMGRFYRRLGAGEGVARALQAAQVEMSQKGYLPYQWAPFIVIGLP